MKKNSVSVSTVWPRAELAVLIFLWLFALIWNFDKAFHIDDTAHLEIARWIAQQPLRPLSGLLNWGNDFEPIYVTNQPPLYFYLMAVVGMLFGWTEVAMHSVMALFVLWAIVAFYGVARVFSTDNAIWLTCLFALNPAFVLGQNTMVDVPLIALWLQFFYSLLRTDLSDSGRFFSASIFCTLALLVKYTSLVLLPILVLHILLRRRWINLLWLLIPVAALSCWSIFNIYDFGKAHMVGRPVAARSTRLYWDLATYWVGVLGAITPFAGLAFYSKARLIGPPLMKAFWWGLFALCWLTYALTFSWFVVKPQWLAINFILTTMFLVTGAGLLIVALKEVSVRIFSGRTLDLNSITLAYWVLAPALFLVVFTPFMAMRHVLLSLPAVLLLSCTQSIKSMKPIAIVAVSVSLLMSCLLAAADKWYAEIYRNEAAHLRDRFPNEAIWFNSNFGWQWYATERGMKHYSNRADMPQPVINDIIVETNSACCALVLNKNLILEKIEQKSIPRDQRVARFASIMPYASGVQAWGYSYAPIESFTLWRVVKQKE